MTIPFFLTRQTANLMEDFARELGSEGAIFLLYGEDGVGKTRLLQELCHSRFSERRIHWLDLGSGDSADGTRFDYSHGIEELFAKAGRGDIVVADHFEEALKKTRHQLFLSWSSEGVDKQLDMIVVSSNDGFNELRQLSQQYQVRIQSFQLMPFSSDEVEAFLCFCLFPDQPAGKPKIPGPVRKQLAATQGNVGKLIEVIERDGRLVKAPVAVESESIRQGSRIIGAVLALFVLAVAIGWFFFRDVETSFSETVALRENESSSVQRSRPDAPPPPAEPLIETGQAASRAPGGMQAASETVDPEGDAGAAGETAIAAGDAPPDASAAGSGAAVDDPDSGFESAASPAPAAPPATDSLGEPAAPADTGGADTGAADAAPGADDHGVAGALASATEDEAVRQPAATGGGEIDPDAGARTGSPADSGEPAGESAADPSPGEPGPLAGAERAAPQPQSNRERFARDLESSMQWLGRRETGMGTVQIMLLSSDSFDVDAYYRYVASLARRQVDTGQLRVFKTLTGNKEVYSVFFGEYDSRRAAFRAIERLPKALRDAAPIPRSVGGILQEIRRLDAKN